MAAMIPQYGSAGIFLFRAPGLFGRTQPGPRRPQNLPWQVMLHLLQLQLQLMLPQMMLRLLRLRQL